VAVDGVMQTLVERGLVEQVGRAEVVGRPMTYDTTGMFLEYFGLRALEDLPAADELRRIPVTRPESLLTADPGLATTPPEQLSLAEVEGGPSNPAAPPEAPLNPEKGSEGTPISYRSLKSGLPFSFATTSALTSGKPTLTPRYVFSTPLPRSLMTATFPVTFPSYWARAFSRWLSSTST
jgi:hypothetical protein